MRLSAYLFCTSLCLAAYLAVAFVAYRDRLGFPLLYACWAAAVCAASLVGVARPEFVASFNEVLLPACMMAVGIFALAEVSRHTHGVASHDEMILATALVCGCGISTLAGIVESPGYGRLALQAAGVVVPKEAF